MKATVYKSTGSWYIVRNEERRVFNARIKGKFRIDEDITSSNPIAVGDSVEIEIENESTNEAIINAINNRRNFINRVSPHNKNQHHIVASNIDQVLLFATLKNPKTSQGFIDRFLITAEAYHIPAILVFNKIDVYGKKELEQLENVRYIYESIGYKVMGISITENKGVKEVYELLKNKRTLLSGHSGVGKSSFINTIFPDLSLKTKDVSGWSGKGMHTTTFAEMFDLPFGGQIIDTPGIRELGLVDISKQELSHYFPEMKAVINDCKYNNCMHINEPDCAVKEAVMKQKISEERYISYLTILDSIETKSY